MSFKNIVWLASYPKSGNTWTRMFLANYLMNAEQPLPINQAHRFTIGDAIASTYKLVANGVYDPNDGMRHLKLREKVLRGIAGNNADVNLVKTHFENGKAFGVPLILQRYTRAAVYIIRNPLDMVISYGRHYGQSPAEVVEAVSRPDNATKADDRNVAQYIGTWSGHVKSWTGKPKFPVHTIRYEDMAADPHKTFALLLKFMKVPVDEERLDRAIGFSSFNELRRQEDEYSFIEKSEQSEKFFHTGTTGQWQDVLTPEQVALIREQHGKVMSEFGYV